MANVQDQFEEFDSKIRLGGFNEEETLRQKRNIVRKKLREHLPGVFETHDFLRLPSPTSTNTTWTFFGMSIATHVPGRYLEQGQSS